MSMPTCIKNQNAALSVGRPGEVNNTSRKIASEQTGMRAGYHAAQGLRVGFSGLSGRGFPIASSRPLTDPDDRGF